MSKTEEALPAEVGFALLLNHLKQWRRSGIDDEPIKVAEECFRAALAQRQQVPDANGWRSLLIGGFVQKWSGNDLVKAGDVLDWIMDQPIAAAPALTAAPSAQPSPPPEALPPLERAQRDEAKRRWISEQDDCNLLEAYDRGWKDRAALAQRQQVPPLSDRCDWCCGTGRFADHACRFCGGKAKGSVFTSQQQQSAQPEQQPVAWRYRYSTKGRWNYADGPANDPAVIEEPLYATQPRAVEPLTQRQLAMLKFLYGSGLISGVGFGCKPDGVTAPYWWRHELAEAFPVLRGIGKQEGK